MNNSLVFPLGLGWFTGSKMPDKFIKPNQIENNYQSKNELSKQLNK